MKRITYLLLPALAGCFFIACNNQPQGPSQAELDAQVEAKVKAATDQLKTDCDNRIHQTAQRQADSILAGAAMNKPAEKSEAHKAPAKEKNTHTTQAAPPPPPPPPPPPNGGKKTNESGENMGKKGATAPNGDNKTSTEGQNMGKKK